jgi:nucleotide-binding universal stress UspA family protein
MPGGTVHEVMREAGTDVAVLVDRGLENVRRVLVPFIGGSNDRTALTLARRLMRSAGAEVTVLHVATPERGPVSARVVVDELFAEESGRVHLKWVAHDVPEETALDESRRGYDLVVVGAGPEWGWEDSLGDAPTSLLVVSHPHQFSSEELARGAATALPAGAPTSESR